MHLHLGGGNLTSNDLTVQKIVIWWKGGGQKFSGRSLLGGGWANFRQAGKVKKQPSFCIRFFIFLYIVLSNMFQTTWRHLFVIDPFFFCPSRVLRTHSNRSISPEVFLWKVVLKICSKFTGEHPCGSVISIKLLCNFINVTLSHGCPLVNLLLILTTPFYKNTFEGLLVVKDIRWTFLRH